MKLVAIALFLVACGSKSPPPAAPEPAPPTEATEDEGTGDDDPMFQASMAATDWNMGSTGMSAKTEAEMEELATRTKQQLQLACEQGNVCGCNALKTGNCECPDEPSCAGEPFWFVSGN
jgi:hypothetical protein